jgi:hypothetical protein
LCVLIIIKLNVLEMCFTYLMELIDYYCPCYSILVYRLMNRDIGPYICFYRLWCLGDQIGCGVPNLQRVEEPDTTFPSQKLINSWGTQLSTSTSLTLKLLCISYFASKIQIPSYNSLSHFDQLSVKSMKQVRK